MLNKILSFLGRKSKRNPRLKAEIAWIRSMSLTALLTVALFCLGFSQGCAFATGTVQGAWRGAKKDIQSAAEYLQETQEYKEIPCSLQ